MSAEKIEEMKSKLVLNTLENKQELRDWMTTYLDIKFPMGTVYPTSTHGPIDAMWRIYELMKTGENQDIPQVTMLSSRDSYKTLGAAALEVLCMLHFRISIAHMAAIKSQSDKAIEYANSFFRKLKPYLETKGWKQISDNKTKMEWLTETGQNLYLRVIIATVAGANSEHCPMLFIDEVDVIQDPRALKEAKMIPSMSPNGKFPLTVYLSTRKFAGGLMEKTLKETIEAGGEILRWNIIDICERISLEAAQADLPKVTRYITTQLPMENLSEEDWEKLQEEHKVKYEKFEAYAGIAENTMLPVMRNYLVDRPQEDTGNLYKPFPAVRNNFKQIGDPDWAEAQLLCNKPSSSGLVYPRFDPEFNVISVEEALTRLLGDAPEVVSFKYLKQYLLDLGITIIGGGDWGYTDYTFLPILALLPSGEVWLMTNHLANKMELDDIVEVATEFNEGWRVEKWYVDQAMPAYIKTLKRKGLKVPKFTKIVEDGIAALQGKIVNSENIRKFFIIDVPENKPVINAFGEYRWKIDGKGDTIEGQPHHDKEGISDMMDGLRYPFQNMFTRGSGILVTSSGDFSQKKIIVPKTGSMAEIASSVNQQIMQQKIGELSKSDRSGKKKGGKKNKKKILHF